MGKTETIKERAIYVYLPTPQMVARWKGMAEKNGQSISKFVIDRVEDSIADESEDRQNRVQLFEEIKRLTELLKGKDDKIRLQELLIEKYEQDLRSYRARLFSDDSTTGIRKFDKELVNLLREPGPHSHDEILARLRIEPSESEEIKAVQRQLDHLQSFGLAKEARGGWLWIGPKQ